MLHGNYSVALLVSSFPSLELDGVLLRVGQVDEGQEADSFDLGGGDVSDLAAAMRQDLCCGVRDVIDLEREVREALAVGGGCGLWFVPGVMLTWLKRFSGAWETRACPSSG